MQGRLHCLAMVRSPTWRRCWPCWRWVQGSVGACAGGQGASLPQDVAGYINTTKGDYESMKVIEEVEESFENYRGPSLLTYGRYHLDGELRVKPVEASGQPKSK